MITHFLVFIAFLLGKLDTNSKSTFCVIGSVKTSSMQVLPFANVYVSDLGKGVTTNQDGEFALYLPIEAKDKTLTISYIGYKKKSHILAGVDERLQFVMEEESIILGEITVGSLTAQSVIEKAIGNISLNYLNTGIYLTAFNRETRYENDNFAYMGEALTITYSAPFFDFISENQVKVLKGQIVSSPNLVSNNYKTEVVNGIEGTVFLDFIKIQPSFTKLRLLRNYHFEFASSSKLDGVECYQIKFYSDLQKYRGQLIIEKKNYAFVKAIIELTPVGLRGISKGTHKVESYKINSSYRQIGDRWCFSNGQAIVEFRESKSPLKVSKIVVDAVVTEMNLKDVVPFRSSEINKNNTFSNSVKLKYDTSFWKKQNIIKLPKKYFQ